MNITILKYDHRTDIDLQKYENHDVDEVTFIDHLNNTSVVKRIQSRENTYNKTYYLNGVKVLFNNLNIDNVIRMAQNEK